MTPYTALITGASRGIGFAIAQHIAASTSELLLTSRRRDTMSAARTRIAKKALGPVRGMSCDHSRPVAAARRVGRWAAQHLSSLDLLVLNAGYYVEGSLAEISSEDFEQNLSVNFRVNHYLTQALLPLLRSSRRARIVVIGSTAAYEAYHAVPSYGVAKWALRGYAVNLRRELRADRIGVTFVAPGGTLTDMWGGERIPPRRLLDPQDIATLVATVMTLTPQAVVDELICRPMLGDLHD